MSMLAEANLPPSFWTYALSTYRHVHNCCSTSALPCNKTPFEAYKGRKPRIGHLHVFGCAAYVLVSREKRQGLDGHSLSSIFIGYPNNNVGWKVYIPKTKRVIVSRDVVFNELRFLGVTTSNAIEPPLHMFEYMNDSDYCDTDADSHIDPTLSNVNEPENNGPVHAAVKELDDDEPLTPLTSDDKAQELVGDVPDSVGAESSHQPGRAPCQPRPLPPP